MGLWYCKTKKNYLHNIMRFIFFVFVERYASMLQQSDYYNVLSW